MNGLSVPIDFSFAIGETFAPPPFLWQVWNATSCLWVPINMSNFTAAFTARQTPFSLDPPVIDATTENGFLAIDGPGGSTQLILPAWYTSELTPVEVEWDFWVYSPTYLPVVTRLFGGRLCIYEGITHA